MSVMSRLNPRRPARGAAAIDSFVAGLRERRAFLGHLPELPANARRSQNQSRHPLRALWRRLVKR